jgi:ABC-type nickel/cobalt efflux system permease component RcnA
MIHGPELLLVGAVAVVGVLHTIVPDHWLPIALIARERGWSRAETARAALQAGTGHVLSTLVIGLAVWAAGVAVAQRFGQFVDAASGTALIGFGAWVAFSAWREMHPTGGHGHGHSHAHPHRHDDDHLKDQDHQHGHSHPHDSPLPHEHQSAPADDRLYAPLRGDAALLTRHVHIHRHGGAAVHTHWHDHFPATAHPLLAEFAADPPLHVHRHKTTARTALLLILGSSPMVEGIPAFFAAAKYGIGLIIPMAAVFALSTITAYVLLCVQATAGLQRLRFGALERYGEVLSGAVIALVGLIFGLWPAF